MSAENAPAPRSSRAPGAGTSQALIREHASNELVFAVVGHAGAGTSTVATQLKEVLENSALKGGPFEVRILKASGEITAWARSRGEDPPEGQGDNIDRIAWLQDKGDEMRKEDHAAVAIAMAARIRAVRAERQNAKLNIDEPVVPDGTRRAYIVDSIKHPAEVHLLRSIYQTAFTLVGAVCEEEVRVRRLMTKYGNAGEKRARDFMARDALEKEKKYGQRV